MPSRILHVLAWLLLGLLAFATLSPIGLRPVTGASADLERFVAFALVGLLFAMAYPRHVILVVVLVLSSAVALEGLQMLAAGRHARLGDTAVKLLGGSLGVALGWMLTRYWPLPRRSK